MANPFEKRATEYLRDDEAGFLSIVSPEPLRTYLEPYASQGQLYEKLVRIIGSPGSGKTTMATLVESRMVSAVRTPPSSFTAWQPVCFSTRPALRIAWGRDA